MIDPKLFFYIFATKIQLFVIACDEFLYAIFIDLCCLSI